MTQLNETQIMQAAQILTDSIPIGWPTLQDALDEINELLVPENTLLAAVENGDVIGWGGILPQYNGNVFELESKKNISQEVINMLLLKNEQINNKIVRINREIFLKKIT